MKKSPDYAFHSKTHTSPLPLVGNVSLPILPKPLSILKTAGKQLCNSKQTCKIHTENYAKRPIQANSFRNENIPVKVDMAWQWGEEAAIRKSRNQGTASCVVFSFTT